MAIWKCLLQYTSLQLCQCVIKSHTIVIRGFFQTLHLWYLCIVGSTSLIHAHMSNMCCTLINELLAVYTIRQIIRNSPIRFVGNGRLHHNNLKVHVHCQVYCTFVEEISQILCFLFSSLLYQINHNYNVNLYNTWLNYVTMMQSFAHKEILNLLDKGDILPSWIHL